MDDFVNVCKGFVWFSYLFSGSLYSQRFLAPRYLHSRENHYNPYYEYNSVDWTNTSKVTVLCLQV